MAPSKRSGAGCSASRAGAAGEGEGGASNADEGGARQRGGGNQAARGDVPSVPSVLGLLGIGRGMSRTSRGRETATAAVAACGERRWVVGQWVRG